MRTKIESAELFKRASQKVREGAALARQADQLRRQSAALEPSPKFPKRWGSYERKYFMQWQERVEKRFEIKPENGPFLTIFVFREAATAFEATATFDLWEVSSGPLGAAELVFRPSIPWGIGWQMEGPSNFRSTLWTRGAGNE